MKKIFFTVSVLCYFVITATTSSAASAHYTFIPVADVDVVSYHIKSKAEDGTEINILVPQPLNVQDRLYVEISDMEAGKTYEFTASSVTAQGIESFSSYPISYSIPVIKLKQVREFEFDI